MRSSMFVHRSRTPGCSPPCRPRVSARNVPRCLRLGTVLREAGRADRRGTRTRRFRRTRFGRCFGRNHPCRPSRCPCIRTGSAGTCPEVLAGRSSRAPGCSRHAPRNRARRGWVDRTEAHTTCRGSARADRRRGNIRPRPVHSAGHLDRRRERSAASDRAARTTYRSPRLRGDNTRRRSRCTAVRRDHTRESGRGRAARTRCRPRVHPCLVGSTRRRSVRRSAPLVRTTGSRSRDLATRGSSLRRPPPPSGQADRTGSTGRGAPVSQAHNKRAKAEPIQATCFIGLSKAVPRRFEEQEACPMWERGG